MANRGKLSGTRAQVGRYFHDLDIRGGWMLKRKGRPPRRRMMNGAWIRPRMNIHNVFFPAYGTPLRERRDGLSGFFHDSIITDFHLNYLTYMDIPKPRINNQITAPELRVIGEKGENLGVMPLDGRAQACPPRGRCRPYRDIGERQTARRAADEL